MRTITSLVFLLLSACTTIIIAPPGTDGGTPTDDGSVVHDDTNIVADAGPDNDAWGDPTVDAWVDPTVDAGTVVAPDAWVDPTVDAGPGTDAWTMPVVHCDADELLDAPTGRCWSYNVTDGICPPGRDVGWWTTTEEQARVQTLMASLTTNALVNTALIRNSAGSWVWQGHSGVAVRVTWIAPHPASTDRHAALMRTGMTADSFSLAAGGGTLCVRSGT